MQNVSLSDYILLAALSYCIMRFINLYDVKECFKKIFTKYKHDANRLPIDYDLVHSQLDAQVKRLAKKHDVKLKFGINTNAISCNQNECFVYFVGKNITHEFSFSFFVNLKNIHKKTPVSAIQRLVFRIASDLEDKLINFIILDKLTSLENKTDVSAVVS